MSDTIMKKILLLLVFITLCTTPCYSDEEGDNSQVFQHKLSLMLEKINKSIKILRVQIVNNQNAPFLADLYLQLGNLLNQKANVLYYIQMERLGSTGGKTTRQTFKAVVESSMEALDIYNSIIRDFKTFDKLPKVLYLQAVTFHAIGKTEQFKESADLLVDMYGNTIEAMRARLLLGKHYYNEADFLKAEEFFEPALKSQSPYERNQARYHMGLIYQRQDKNKAALKMFEAIVLDEELDLQDQEKKVLLKTKKISSSIKREALIDSIKVFTLVYPNHKDPVSYYASIAPSETLFQEVIEKLAFRYINLKKYNIAINLLRALSERTADPEKVINIYQEVLVMVPLHRRLDVKIDEIRYVLQKFNIWFNFYTIDPKLRKTAEKFLEIQIREFGTKSHDIAKKKRGKKRKIYMKRAAKFYQLYLGFFPESPNKVKIATNLADVLYNLKQYPDSGSYYIRIASEEFGKVNKKGKEKYIENALYILQKKKRYSFYEQIWRRGLLINAIQTFFEADEKRKNDEKLNFILAKTFFEQSLYDHAINKLHEYLKTFPGGKFVEDAGDLIISYYNDKGDYVMVKKWTENLLEMNLKNPQYVAKLRKINKQAKVKSIDVTLKESGDFDELSKGKSYFDFAMKTTDTEMMDVAFKQALQKSRDEGDVETFFKAAETLAKNENDADKLQKIYQLIAHENLNLSNYYDAIDALMTIVEHNRFDLDTKIESFIEVVTTAVALKDYNLFSKYISHRLWRDVPQKIRERMYGEIANLAESPAPIKDELIELIINESNNPTYLLSLYKGQFKMSPQLKRDVIQKISLVCSDGSNLPLCRWAQFSTVDDAHISYITALNNAPTTADQIAQYGNEFVSIMQSFQQLTDSGDLHLNLLIAIRNIELFGAFAKYLRKVANANIELREALLAKAKESENTQKEYVVACKSISSGGQILTTLGKYCDPSSSRPLLKDALTFKFGPIQPPGPSKDIIHEDILEIQQQILLSGKQADAYLELGKEYLTLKQYKHVHATALYGMSIFEDYIEDFNALMGCASLRRGLVQEAFYYLQEASDYEGLREECTAALKKFKE